MWGGPEFLGVVKGGVLNRVRSVTDSFRINSQKGDQDFLGMQKGNQKKWQPAITDAPLRVKNDCFLNAIQNYTTISMHSLSHG